MIYTNYMHTDSPLDNPVPLTITTTITTTTGISYDPLKLEPLTWLTSPSPTTSPYTTIIPAPYVPLTTTTLFPLPFLSPFLGETKFDFERKIIEVYDGVEWVEVKMKTPWEKTELETEIDKMREEVKGV